MTRFGYVMTTYFALLGFVWAAIFPISPRFIWNASASVPIGLYGTRRAGCHPQQGRFVPAVGALSRP